MAVLEDSFAINMTPFFKNAEPQDNATAIKLFNENDAIEVPIDLLPYLFFQFAKDGKRMYDLSQIGRTDKVTSQLALQWHHFH
jgi:hypothetical protein